MRLMMLALVYRGPHCGPAIRLAARAIGLSGRYARAFFCGLRVHVKHILFLSGLCTPSDKGRSKTHKLEKRDIREKKRGARRIEPRGPAPLVQ